MNDTLNVILKEIEGVSRVRTVTPVTVNLLLEQARWNTPVEDGE